MNGFVFLLMMLSQMNPGRLGNAVKRAVKKRPKKRF